MTLDSTPLGPNTIDGFIVDTTYLGEIAQHEFQSSDGSTVRTAELNPHQNGESPEKVWLHAIARPEDVIVLQAHQSMAHTTR